ASSSFSPDLVFRALPRLAPSPLFVRSFFASGPVSPSPPLRSRAGHPSQNRTGFSVAARRFAPVAGARSEIRVCKNILSIVKLILSIVIKWHVACFDPIFRKVRAPIAGTAASNAVALRQQIRGRGHVIQQRRRSHADHH